MGHNWVASVDRIFRTISGSKRIDKVPFLPFAGEQMICRITGKTVRELYNSAKTFEQLLNTEYICLYLLYLILLK